MTPRSSAPSCKKALGRDFSPPEAFTSGASSSCGCGSAAAGTLRRELLELLVEIRRRDSPPPPVRPDLDADRVRRRDLGKRERTGLCNGGTDLRRLCLRQLHVGNDERELVIRQSAPFFRRGAHHGGQD